MYFLFTLLVAAETPLLSVLTHPFGRPSVSVCDVATDEHKDLYWHKQTTVDPQGLHLLWPKTLTFAALDGNTLAPRPKQPYLSHFLEVLVDSFVPPTAVVQKLIYMHKTKGYCGRDFSSAAASAFRSTERAFHASVCPSVCLSDCLAMN